MSRSSKSVKIPPLVTLSLHAMATRFELVLCGEDEVRLRAAGEEALQEIARLEAQLNFYSPASEISWINTRAAERPVKVEPRLFRLIQNCADLTASTDFAFDITIGPLMRVWFRNQSGTVPFEKELDAAARAVGIRNLELDEEGQTVRFKQAGTKIDLGAFGKGYAIEKAVELLLENGVSSAFLEGGASSIFAVGAPPGDRAWRVGLHDLFQTPGTPNTVDLRDLALSLSAAHGKFFEEGGRRFGHVLDPRTGWPVEGNLAAVVVGESPSICEALSTALMVNGAKWISTLTSRFPGYRGAIAHEDGTSGVEVRRFD